MQDAKLNTGRVGAGKSAAIGGTAESKVKDVKEAEATAALQAAHDKHPLKSGKHNPA